MQDQPIYSVNLDEIRAYIRSLLAEKHLTVAKLAEITGISKGTLDNFFDGSTKAPTFDKVCTIIVKLGGSVDQALGLKQPIQSSTPQMDLTHLLAAHHETIEAKNETIAGLKQELAEERIKASKSLRWQKLFVTENIILAFLFVLDFFNHEWGYFRGGLLGFLFERVKTHHVIYKG